MNSELSIDNRFSNYRIYSILSSDKIELANSLSTDKSRKNKAIVVAILGVIIAWNYSAVINSHDFWTSDESVSSFNMMLPPSKK